MSDNVLTSFLGNFDQYPFCVKIGQDEYKIGEGKPEFVVNFKKQVSMHSLITSTSLALGEAYMNGDLEVEGDLYHALNHFLGQMGKFSTDEKALKKLIFTPMSKKNQQKEVQSHYDIGNDFYKLWLDDSMSYSCGYFQNESDTLKQAQAGKVDYILRKLNLKKDMYLLDIGCGWGLGDMRFYTVGVESLRRHYNRTLLCWNENFQKHRREVVEMFDERFARMWELFLCSCAATFMNGIIGLHQIIFTSDVNNELPMTKWY